MESPLADLLLKLAVGVPVGNGVCRIPLHVSIRMSEQQLFHIADTLTKKPSDDEVQEPDPREFHREWAKQNRISDWDERELWAKKSAE